MSFEIFTNEKNGKRYKLTSGGKRRYLCNIDGCTNSHQNNGVCLTHGAKTIKCRVDGCTNSRVNNGVCRRHGATTPKCHVEGCTNNVQNNDVCYQHGAEVPECRVNGCTKKVQNSGVCYYHGAKTLKCRVNGCINNRVNNGVCVTHGAKTSECRVNGCTKNAKNNGVCFGHGAVYPESALCSVCKLVITSRGHNECLDCRIRGGEIISQRERQEIRWLEKLVSWGYHPSSHDRVVKDSNCDVVNRRRIDYLFLTNSSFKYHVVVECDEHSHSGYDVSCEMARLEDIHDQLIANGSSVKPIVVVRFNPDSKHDIESELKETLEFVFRGTIDTFDARGVNLYKLIGYGNKRKQMYDESPITKQIKLNDQHDSN